MKFTNSEGVKGVIDVPMEGCFGFWDVRLYCKIGDKAYSQYSQGKEHLYIPRIFSIQNTISEEIER